MNQDTDMQSKLPSPMLTSLFQSAVLPEELCLILLDEIQQNGDPSQHHIFNEDTRRMLAKFLVRKVSSYLEGFLEGAHNIYTVDLKNEVRKLIASEELLQEVIQGLNAKINGLQEAHWDHTIKINAAIHELVASLPMTYQMTPEVKNELPRSLLEDRSPVSGFSEYHTIELPEDFAPQIDSLRNLMRTSRLRINHQSQPLYQQSYMREAKKIIDSGSMFCDAELFRDLFLQNALW